MKRTLRTLSVAAALSLCGVGSAGAESMVALVSETWAPPLMVRDGGKFSGFMPDFFNIIADEAGLTPQYESYARLRLDEAILTTGDVRCHITPSWVEPRARGQVTWSDPVYSIADMLIVSTEQEAAAYPGMEALTGVVATVRGYKYPQLDAAFASGRLKREDVNSEEQIIRKVAAGRNGMGVVNVMAAAYAAASNPGLRGKFRLADVVEETPIHCAVRKDSPRAQAISAAIVRAKANGRIDALVRRYTHIETAELVGGR